MGNCRALLSVMPVSMNNDDDDAEDAMNGEVDGEIEAGNCVLLALSTFFA